MISRCPRFQLPADARHQAPRDVQAEAETRRIGGRRHIAYRQLRGIGFHLEHAGAAVLDRIEQQVGQQPPDRLPRRVQCSAGATSTRNAFARWIRLHSSRSFASCLYRIARPKRQMPPSGEGAAHHAAILFMCPGTV